MKKAILKGIGFALMIVFIEIIIGIIIISVVSWPEMHFVDNLPEIIERGEHRWQVPWSVTGIYFSEGQEIWVQKRCFCKTTRTMFHELGHWAAHCFLSVKHENKFDIWLDNGREYSLLIDLNAEAIVDPNWRPK